MPTVLFFHNFKILRRIKIVLSRIVYNSVPFFFNGYNFIYFPMCKHKKFCFTVPLNLLFPPLYLEFNFTNRFLLEPAYFRRTFLAMIINYPMSFAVPPFRRRSSYLLTEPFSDIRMKGIPCSFPCKHLGILYFTSSRKMKYFISVNIQDIVVLSFST